jgi:type VI secretion system protein
MAAASLLVRLMHAADPHNTERYTWKDNDLESALARHIAVLLSTRQGTALTCPDYGLAEVSEVLYDFPEAIGIMQRSIKNTIQTYEPRLKNVQVRHIRNEQSNMMTLEFEVTGQIVLPDGRRQSLRFATSIDGNGSVKVGS